ncbi:MAG: asparaginase [Alphaproteobacteria bacterium]|nr:asparaginase [Alphaproteobacteria bacterium]
MAKVLFIGTGGTMSALSSIGPFDIQDYSSNGRFMEADEIIDHWSMVRELADVVPIRYRNVASTALGPAEWLEILALCHSSFAAHPDAAGIVVGHGTATLEETAFFLSLTHKLPVPIVVVGAQRPSSGLSSDAGANLANAIRVAADPGARGLGALVLLNDEINAARDVTKTSTGRMQTFRSADFGCLGQADGDRIAWYRRPLRRVAPDTEFDLAGVAALPRVDVMVSYAGSDGVAVDAYMAAAAQGIVIGGFAPGFMAPGEADALARAHAAGVVVVVSSRAGSGRVFSTSKKRALGFIDADNLTPQKARILLMLALTRTREPAEIARIFAEY